MNRHLLCIAAILCGLPSMAIAGDELKGSGLPVPRFVSLKSNEINVRTGPGTRYPISWVYRQEGLPVEIVDEFENWRKIRDFENAEGWILKNMLSGDRTVMIKGKEPQIIYRSAEKDASPVLRAAPRVVGKLAECEPDWCKIQVDSRKGWIQKTNIWGVYPNEVLR